MSDTSLLDQIRAALALIPHGDDCAIRGDVNLETPCDCDRDEIVAQRVTAAIGAAWRFNPYNRNRDGVLRALAPPLGDKENT